VNTEADTCRKFVVPRLQTADWEGAPHAINERRTCTDGRVIFLGGKAKRGRQKRADYILRYRADYPIAVVEAKAAYKSAADGLQQAKDYAEILGPKFAYSSERWLTRRRIAGAEVGTIFLGHRRHGLRLEQKLQGRRSWRAFPRPPRSRLRVTVPMPGFVAGY
jgi:type I site-specific restriction endonuclease